MVYDQRTKGGGMRPCSNKKTFYRFFLFPLATSSLSRFIWYSSSNLRLTNKWGQKINMGQSKKDRTSNLLLWKGSPHPRLCPELAPLCLPVLPVAAFVCCPRSWLAACAGWVGPRIDLPWWINSSWPFIFQCTFLFPVAVILRKLCAYLKNQKKRVKVLKLFCILHWGEVRKNLLGKWLMVRDGGSIPHAIQRKERRWIEIGLRLCEAQGYLNTIDKMNLEDI